MGMHEPITTTIVTRLSNAYARKRERFLADGGLDDAESAELQHDHETLELVQEFDDNLAEGVAIIRYGRTLPYHAKRRRSRQRDLSFSIRAD